MFLFDTDALWVDIFCLFLVAFIYAPFFFVFYFFFSFIHFLLCSFIWAIEKPVTSKPFFDSRKKFWVQLFFRFYIFVFVTLACCLLFMYVSLLFINGNTGQLSVRNLLWIIVKYL